MDYKMSWRMKEQEMKKTQKRRCYSIEYKEFKGQTKTKKKKKIVDFIWDVRKDSKRNVG